MKLGVNQPSGVPQPEAIGSVQRDRAKLSFSDILSDQTKLVDALTSIQLTDKQRSHLGKLFASENGEACHRDKGMRVQSETRYSCSVIGKSLTKYFSITDRIDHMMWIGDLRKDGNTEQWVMKPQIRDALVQLGWFGLGPTIPSGSVQPNRANGVRLAQDNASLAAEQALLDAVEKSLRDDPMARAARLAIAPKVPEKYQLTTTAFKRNPDVIAEVLIRAAGICEACLKPAPFLKAKDGLPYLEVHHKHPLAADGYDSVDNAIAICPNCHRKAHYGVVDSAGALGR